MEKNINQNNFNMNLETNKIYETEKYKQHQIFELLEDMLNFYTSISYQSFPFINGDTCHLFNIDSYIFSSEGGTINSIHMILEKARINDAYALARKYYDIIIFDVYRWQFINDNKSLEHLYVDEINDWTKGKMKSKWYEPCMNYIKASENLKEINALFDLDNKDRGLYAKIRKRCNDNEHYNYLYYLLLNDNSIYLTRRIHELDQLQICLRRVLILHFSYIIFMHCEYFVASDYIDYLDLGETPPKGCEYRVAPFADNMFVKYIHPYNKLKDFLVTASSLNWQN